MWTIPLLCAKQYCLMLCKFVRNNYFLVKKYVPIHIVSTLIHKLYWQSISIPWLHKVNQIYFVCTTYDCKTCALIWTSICNRSPITHTSVRLKEFKNASECFLLAQLSMNLFSVCLQRGHIVTEYCWHPWPVKPLVFIVSLSPWCPGFGHTQALFPIYTGIMRVKENNVK